MEFVEVFKHAQRLCKHMGFHCGKCPIRNHDGGCQLKPLEHGINLAEAERRVIAWAKEHPEPLYPTWGKWLAEYGIVLADSIPADIAEKLGLKPKEANGNDK